MVEQEQTKLRPRSVMEDPSAQAIARTYAEAFLNAANRGDGNVEELLEETASFLEDVLTKHPDFEALLLSAIISRKNKLAVIDRVVAPRASQLFTNFLRVLARHNRLDLLPLILHECRIKFEESTGRRRIQVTSARPLSPELQEKIAERLGQVLPFQPIVEPRTDPRLLGGLVIQIGDTVYDTSLRTRMKQLRARLRERSLNEIQRGRDRFSHPSGD